MGKVKDNLALNGIQDSFFNNIDMNELELKQKKERRIKDILSQLRTSYSVLYKFNPPEETKAKLRVEFLKLMQELNSLGIDAKDEVKKIVNKIEGEK